MYVVGLGVSEQNTQTHQRSPWRIVILGVQSLCVVSRLWHWYKGSGEATFSFHIGSDEGGL